MKLCKNEKNFSEKCRRYHFRVKKIFQITKQVSEKCRRYHFGMQNDVEIQVQTSAQSDNGDTFQKKEVRKTTFWLQKTEHLRTTTNSAFNRFL